jgi:purine-binding chemotaxis protein CheW
MSVSEITETRQYLTFKLGNEVFATDVAKVREVLDFTTITEIPRTPDFMSGVINLRGSVVPVVDLRLCLEMSKIEKTRNTCIVVVEVMLDNESTVIGVLADSVEEVIDLEPEQIQPAPRIGTHIRTDFIKGMGKRDNQFVMILHDSRRRIRQGRQQPGIAGSDGLRPGGRRLRLAPIFKGSAALVPTGQGGCRSDRASRIGYRVSSVEYQVSRNER